MTRPTSEREFGEPLNGGDAPKPTIFIQANDRQLLGARIAAYSYKRNSSFPDSFDVRVMNVPDFPKLMREGQSFLRRRRGAALDSGRSAKLHSPSLRPASTQGP